MGSCLRAKLGGAAAAQIWGTELLPGSRPPWSLPQGEGTSSLEGTYFKAQGPFLTQQHMKLFRFLSWAALKTATSRVHCGQRDAGCWGNGNVPGLGQVMGSGPRENVNKTRK